MFHRLHIRSRWANLFFCGESTLMGTGTPAVTVSGLSAANAILKKRKLRPFAFSEGMKTFVRVLPKPFTPDQLFSEAPEAEKKIRLAARKCQNCEHPTCMMKTDLDIRGLLRRVVVGNFAGAARLLSVLPEDKKERSRILNEAQTNCIQTVKIKKPVEIVNVVEYVSSLRK
jgi:prolycopene isomerase